MKLFNPALLSAGNFFGIGAMLIFLVTLLWAGKDIAGGGSSAPASTNGNMNA